MRFFALAECALGWCTLRDVGIRRVGEGGEVSFVVREYMFASMRSLCCVVCVCVSWRVCWLDTERCIDNMCEVQRTRLSG